MTNRLDVPVTLATGAGVVLFVLGSVVLVSQLEACNHAKVKQLDTAPPIVIKSIPVPPDPELVATKLAPAMGDGLCDPKTGERGKYSKTQRADTHARVRFTARRLRWSPIMLAWLSVRTTSESSGRAGVRHTKGKGENGLGALGLNLASHRGKWPGEADPDFCVPEVSTVVMAEVAWIAVIKYGAKNAVQIQAVVGGRGHCDLVSLPGERRKYECSAPSHYQDARHRAQKAHLCNGMARRGFSCMAPISARDLGRRRLPKGQRLAFAREARGAYDARSER